MCEEVARRWNGKPCRRWEVGSWRVGSNRGGYTTPEQIRAFVADHPAGCVVYLAGVDALAVEAAHNASYFWVVESEITQLLDHALHGLRTFPDATAPPFAPTCWW